MVTAGPAAPPRYRVPPGQLQALRVKLCFLILAVDCVAIFVGCVLGNLLRYSDPLAASGLNLFAVVLPIYVGIAINSDAYATDVLPDMRVGLSRAAMAYIFAVFAVFFLTFYLKSTESLSRITSSVAIMTALSSMAVGRYACELYIRRRTGMRLVYDLLIIDGVEVTPPPGVHVLDAARDDLTPNMRDPHMLNRLGQRLNGVDRVVIACPPERRHLWAMLLKGSSVNGHILAEELDALGAIGIGSFSGKHTLAVAHAPLDLSRRATKRTLDLALTVPGLIFLTPLLIVVAIAIKLDSPGPVFFLQPRVGRGNRIFLTYKFRSMRADRTDAAGAQSTRKDDDRVTRVGRFIRASSIDELPQLLNVLRGEMSLVGPRPHALGSLAGDELFWEVDERYWHRHASKPGLTGLAQVRGYRGETKATAGPRQSAQGGSGISERLDDLAGCIDPVQHTLGGDAQERLLSSASAPAVSYIVKGPATLPVQTVARLGPWLTIFDRRSSMEERSEGYEIRAACRLVDFPARLAGMETLFHERAQQRILGRAEREVFGDPGAPAMIPAFGGRDGSGRREGR